MRKIFLLTLVGCFCEVHVPAQSQKPKETIIDTFLQAISNFQTRESKRDSVLNHPLGSNSEEDFLRRYTFYDSAYTALHKIDKTSLSTDALINLELIKYDVEDELSTWKFKSYLNPILADEGFHTGLTWLDDRSLLYDKIRTGVKMGALNRMLNAKPGLVYTRFLNFSEEEKEPFYNAPAYISGFDFS